MWLEFLKNYRFVFIAVLTWAQADETEKNPVFFYLRMSRVVLIFPNLFVQQVN